MLKKDYDFFELLKNFDLNTDNIYLVGGSVRDILLGLKPNDLDYVAVNTSKTQMLNAGFHQIGSDFPVFIHPRTKIEVALARTEKKTNVGHKGFDVNFNEIINANPVNNYDNFCLQYLNIFF